MPAEAVTVLLCGDVMLGRGVDQILPHPGDPTLREPYVRDARTYVEMAEDTNGPIPSPVEFSWPWGDALQVLEATPDVRLVNLETSITRSDGFAAGKGIHYRMSPDNMGSLVVARPDCCVLANNHVLDFGADGLDETLDVLSSAGLKNAGAGRDETEARKPAVVPLDDGGRVRVFSVGMASSGVPAQWAATRDGPGVDFVARPTEATADQLLERIHEDKQDSDLVVVSVHWGSNWGYEIPSEQTNFAHRLVDGGVDVIHGHSSHHPRPVEIYNDRLIMYGCGDLINDYEGISGHEGYRDDLRLLYIASLNKHTGAVRELRMVPLQARRMRLERASIEDADWLCDLLGRISRPFGDLPITVGSDGDLTVRRN